MKIDEEGGNTSYATIIFKSLWWPGAYHVCKEGLWASVYIGYGMKAAFPCYSPNQPMDIMDEP